MIRPTKKADVPAILQILEESGQFDADGRAHVHAILETHLASNSNASG